MQSCFMLTQQVNHVPAIGNTPFPDALMATMCAYLPAAEIIKLQPELSIKPSDYWKFAFAERDNKDLGTHASKLIGKAVKLGKGQEYTLPKELDPIVDKIQHLNLHGCHIADDVFERIIRKTPNLVALDISKTQISTQVLPTIVRLEKLEELSLRGMKHLGGLKMELLSLCLNLKTLDLSDCVHITDAALCALKSLAHLRTLILSQARKIRGTTLAEFTGLEKLILTRTGITDAMCALLPKNLKTLGLEYCRITDTAIDLLPDVEELSLACCVQITDLAVTKLSAKLSLKRLNLSQTTITGMSLGQLPDGIEKIIFARCTRVRSDGIMQLKTKPKLTSLVLSKTLIDNRVLTALPAALTHLDILGCRKLTHVAYKALCETHPHLQIEADKATMEPPVPKPPKKPLKRPVGRPVVPAPAIERSPSAVDSECVVS